MQIEYSNQLVRYETRRARPHAAAYGREAQRVERAIRAAGRAVVGGIA